MENITTQMEIATEQVDSADDISICKTSENIDNLVKNFENTLKTLKGYITEIRTMKKEVLFLEKSVKKSRTKKNNRKKTEVIEGGEKRKNGFARPTEISVELAAFLGIEQGIQIARTEVTKRINAYVKEHKLQDQEKKKRILLDSPEGIKLKALLTDIVDINGNPCDLNFINIQKYIKHHFPKKIETSTIAPVSVPEVIPTVVAPAVIPTVVIPDIPVLHQKKKKHEDEEKISGDTPKETIQKESSTETPKDSSKESSKDSAPKDEAKKMKKLIKKRPIEEEITA